MSDRNYAVLLVDPDAGVRALLAEQLTSTGATVIQAADGASALKLLKEREIRLVVTELYLETGEDEDLIQAIRGTKALKRTRTLAHTSRATAADRDWAMRAGADAYLIKPTRAERFRYVVSRLATTKGANSSVADTVGVLPLVKTLRDGRTESPYRE
jgi:CheY-like chemotaxis protein